MFAAQATPQALYHLSQLTFNVRWPSSYRQRCSPQPCVNKSPLCDMMQRLNLHHLPATTATALIPPLKKQRCSISKNWNKSFVSTRSFLENKRQAALPATTCAASSFLNPGLFAAALSSQVRHFKTERRGKEFRGAFKIRDILPKTGGGNNPFEKSAGFESDVLKNVSKLTEDEARRIKIAFAEGFQAANAKPRNKSLKILKLLQNFLLLILIVAVTATVVSTAGGSVFKIQLGNQVEIDAQDINVTFDDVKGVDESKQELQEIVEFLKNPKKFSTLGGKLPKGVLLVGPPGTGKTLLARAVAGEAGVPFFHAAGSEFDEILVGQGARRVRDLFAAAKNRAPCVIFIDEIDAVGGKRTNSVLHPYANQTINQLLSEMDGFHQNEGVIVLGATNRKEDLDRALMRPGRFDVEVTVPVPDITGRKDIFELYLSKIKAKGVDVDALARGTTGFTGADIENVVNLAALKAAMDGSKFVSMKDLENARDKVLMGPERKTRIPDQECNEITAYHEGGHALVAYYTKEAHPIHKVTIMPRAGSFGHTAFLPEKEHYQYRKSQLLASMDTMMGGRAAEELIYGPDRITSGAANDLAKATQMATHMVKEWGMSEKVGLRTMEQRDDALVRVNDLAPSTSEMIDAEIKKILHDSYERAKGILKAHAKEHKLLAEALLKYETLEADDVKAILSSKKDTFDKIG